VVKHRDGRKLRAARHFVSVAGDGVVVGGDARLRAAGDVDQVEGKGLDAFVRAHENRGGVCAWRRGAVQGKAGTRGALMDGYQKKRRSQAWKAARDRWACRERVPAGPAVPPCQGRVSSI